MVSVAADACCGLCAVAGQMQATVHMYLLFAVGARAEERVNNLKKPTLSSRGN